MKRSGVIFLFGASAVGAIVAIAACINEHARPVSDAGPVTGAVDCDSGGPGGFPPPNCDPSDNSCPATGGTCPIDKATCGDPATCLPMADNSTKSVYDFRLRRLWITDPPALTSSVLEGSSGIVTQGIDLASTACGDPGGKGAFNWLVRVDPTGSVTTGGAPPSPDPFTTGYCFYRHELGALDVEPTTVTTTFTNDGGTFTTGSIPLLNVPIFLSPDAGAADPSNVIILPLRNAVLKNATITNDNNCIGSYNLQALDQNCVIADPSSCSKWHTAGSLGAVMTLEDADKVPLTVLPETLCTLLTSATGGGKADGGGCARDGQGNIIAKGDYCSTSNQPGDCADSFWLAATFAAAAVTINDGSTEPTCQGATSDAGPDASDAGTDAADASGE
jgi:hypothetical protein